MHQDHPLGERIRSIRGEMNQEAFAVAVGVNRNTLRAYEKGVNLPNSEFLASVSSKFGINPAWILLGEGPVYRADSEHKSSQHVPATAAAKACPDSELDAVRQENRELRQENRELRIENRELLKQNGDLRVAVAELKARAAPENKISEKRAEEETRKSA